MENAYQSNLYQLESELEQGLELRCFICNEIFIAKSLNDEHITKCLNKIADININEVDRSTERIQQ